MSTVTIKTEYKVTLPQWSSKEFIFLLSAFESEDVENYEWLKEVSDQHQPPEGMSVNDPRNLDIELDYRQAVCDGLAQWVLDSSYVGDMNDMVEQVTNSSVVELDEAEQVG